MDRGPIAPRLQPFTSTCLSVGRGKVELAWGAGSYMEPEFIKFKTKTFKVNYSQSSCMLSGEGGFSIQSWFLHT